MNIEEIKNYLEANKDNSEVQELVSSFVVSPTLEQFKEKVLSDSEFKSFMDSEKDRHHSKALDTWKTNNLEELVNNKVKSLYPEDDPKDIEVNRIKQELEQMKNDANKERMKNLALTKASELKIPTDLVDFFVANDEETTIANLEKFSEKFIENIQSTVKGKLEGNGDSVPKGKGFDTITKEQFDDMEYTEKVELYDKNKDLYDKFTE